MNSLDYAAKLKMPPGWEPRRYEVIGGGFLLAGGVRLGVYRSGPRKGKPKFGPCSKYTCCFVSDAEKLAARDRWEAETGKCADCDGTGLFWYKVHVTEGKSYRPCERCGSTGKAP